ncbi:MAG: hypothetical protein QM589_13500 [Thermomicrobiales bacterium]
MCTRVFYASPSGLALTGWTMDWFSDMPTNLWAWPRRLSLMHGEVWVGNTAARLMPVGPA